LIWPPPPEDVEDEAPELPALALPPLEETLPPELIPPEEPAAPEDPPELAETLLDPRRTGRPSKFDLRFSSGQEISFDRLR